MKRWVYGYRHVAGSPAALEQTLLHRSTDLLRAATGSPDSGPSADGSFVVELRSKVIGLEVGKKVRVATGVAHRAGARVILPITWHADWVTHAFPAFDGTLELEALDSRTAQLTLVGSYRAPLGPIGAAADAVLLRTVGEQTTDALVAALAQALSAAAGAQAPEHVTGPRRGEPLQVGDVMTTDPLVIDEDLPLRTAALMLFHWQVSAAPVVTAAGELLGVLSEGDLLVKEATRTAGLDRRARREDARRAARTAGEACTRPAKTTVPDAVLAHVVRTMLDEDVNRLVVVDDSRIAGIVSRHDVLAALLRADADIEMAVRKVVAMHAGPGVDVVVEWGAVTLTGSTELRSAARRLRTVVADVDGVMTVDADSVEWDINDEILPVAQL